MPADKPVRARPVAHLGGTREALLVGILVIGDIDARPISELGLGPCEVGAKEHARYVVGLRTAVLVPHDVVAVALVPDVKAVALFTSPACGNGTVLNVAVAPELCSRRPLVREARIGPDGSPVGMVAPVRAVFEVVVALLARSGGVQTLEVVVRVVLVSGRLELLGLRGERIADGNACRRNARLVLASA